MYRRSFGRLLRGVVLPATLFVAGCGEKAPKPEVVTLSGKIERIERTTDESGRITVVYYSEQHQQEMSGTGIVTKETEVMINGAIAKLRDLREGDRVTGDVRVEKSGKERKQVALKIHADRSTPSGG